MSDPLAAISETIIVAAVEGGGTSFKLAICKLTSRSAVPKILHRAQIDASHDHPSRTLHECVDFFSKHKPVGGYHALGLACFGPLGVRPDHPNYGCILSSSPKAAWRNVNVLEPLQQACQGSTHKLSILVDTDVNAPALAEYQQALLTQPDLTSTAYITVGTGVGVGLIVNGLPVHGFMHPEGGHVPVQPLGDDTFPGYSWGSVCPFNGKHTVEGLACSISLLERLQYNQGPTGVINLLGFDQEGDTNEKTVLSRDSLQAVSDDDAIWDHAANALANCCVTLILVTSCERIVLGGGILQRRGLMDKIRSRVIVLMNGYVDLPSDLSQLIVTSQAGADAGLVGAMVLAREAWKKSDDHDEQDEEEKKMKRVAYGEGLRHGMIVGALATGLVCKYVFWPRRRK
jgi:fructokinase